MSSSKASGGVVGKDFEVMQKFRVEAINIHKALKKFQDTTKGLQTKPIVLNAHC